MDTESVIERVAAVLRRMEGVGLHHDPDPEPPSDGVYVGADALRLPPELGAYLASNFLNGLFRHQFKAIAHVLNGENTIVATRTSSGKSLIFSVPVFKAMLEDPSATALFLYPQKALANDQLNSLVGAAQKMPTLRERIARQPRLISRYDGATSTEDRPLVRADVRAMLTNPDMLHRGILPWHERHWARFFTNLRYVIIDECHEYRGIFGTNVAYTLRRLRQLCEHYGSNPVFIATSATIAEPQAHLQMLTGSPFVLVGPQDDGSRHGRKKYCLASSAEYYADFGRKLTIALAEAGLRTLAFCPSRVSAERMLSRLSSGKGGLPPWVRVYRAGLSSSEREQVERGLRDGSIRAVFSTSALELGIDIGALDVVICIGLPSSMMSLWQRAGRTARAGKEGAIVLIPAESPIDSYYAEHPDELFGRANEPLVLNLHNKRVVCQQYACATKEIGDEEKLNTTIFGDAFEAVKGLRGEGKLNSDIFYRADPHGDVAIRGGGASNYKLMDGDHEVGEIDEFHLLRECPRNAIYRHDGRAYRVKDVIPGRKIVALSREQTHNDTYQLLQKKIRLKRRMASANFGRVLVETVSIDVTEFLLQITEKDRSGTVVKSYPGTGMPMHRLPTDGTRLVIEKDLWQEITTAHLLQPAKSALASIERLLYSLFPTVSGPCDTQDFSSAVEFADDGNAYVYLYDTVYDGVDLTIGAFDRITDLIDRSVERLTACSCVSDEGCFRCIANPRAAEPSSKRITGLILSAVRNSLQAKPTITRSGEEVFASDLLDDVRVECPACRHPNTATARFCSNCGQKVSA
jgi:DEAD/DEAH box helicase domain-containing protein